MIVLILIMVGIILVNTYRGKHDAKSSLNQHIHIAVQTFPSEGREHTTKPVKYKTFPPTLGPHNPYPAQYGFYNKTIPMNT
ncbi:hypothetical protein NG54_02250 [Heyndrickxia ginsengihumi]|uniref:Uncharacterized protein n=1 Tax=Heyndrickxia ginsengihumi TaxID=363870 RepID=A0A0A6VEG5_9BACI|nr:hypothetical protein NG54_02250 [Heyndrickxia ginsengihumi]